MLLGVGKKNASVFEWQFNMLPKLLLITLVLKASLNLFKILERLL